MRCFTLPAQVGTGWSQLVTCRSISRGVKLQCFLLGSLPSSHLGWLGPHHVMLLEGLSHPSLVDLCSQSGVLQRLGGQSGVTDS